MWRHYVYQHRKADTGEVFYVGKGSMRARERKQRYERAYVSDKSRNPVWRKTVAKHGFVAEVLATFATDADAQAFEMDLIKHYGRRDLGRGPLVNLTDGGDGHAGILTSEELRAKRRVNSSGKRSPAWVASIRDARKNGGNGGVVKAGDKLPDSWREAIAKGQRGPNNYMRGRTGDKHHKARAVVNTETGERFPSVSAAAEHMGVRMQTLHNQLTGFRRNNTPLRFAA